MSDYVIVDGELRYWPMCPIKGCSNRICLSLGSKYCYPHTGAGKSPEKLIEELKRPAVILQGDSK